MSRGRRQADPPSYQSWPLSEASHEAISTMPPFIDVEYMHSPSFSRVPPDEVSVPTVHTWLEPSPQSKRLTIPPFGLVRQKPLCSD